MNNLSRSAHPTPPNITSVTPTHFSHTRLTTFPLPELLNNADIIHFSATVDLTEPPSSSPFIMSTAPTHSDIAKHPHMVEHSSRFDTIPQLHLISTHTQHPISPVDNTIHPRSLIIPPQHINPFYLTNPTIPTPHLPGQQIIPRTVSRSNITQLISQMSAIKQPSLLYSTTPSSLLTNSMTLPHKHLNNNSTTDNISSSFCSNDATDRFFINTPVTQAHIPKTIAFNLYPTEIITTPSVAHLYTSYQQQLSKYNAGKLHYLSHIPLYHNIINRIKLPYILTKKREVEMLTNNLSDHEENDDDGNDMYSDVISTSNTYIHPNATTIHSSLFFKASKKATENNRNPQDPAIGHVTHENHKVLEQLYSYNSVNILYHILQTHCYSYDDLTPLSPHSVVSFNTARSSNNEEKTPDNSDGSEEDNDDFSHQVDTILPQKLLTSEQAELIGVKQGDFSDNIQYYHTKIDKKRKHLNHKKVSQKTFSLDTVNFLASAPTTSLHHSVPRIVTESNTNASHFNGNTQDPDPHSSFIHSIQCSHDMTGSYYDLVSIQKQQTTFPSHNHAHATHTDNSHTPSTYISDTISIHSGSLTRHKFNAHNHLSLHPFLYSPSHTSSPPPSHHSLHSNHPSPHAHHNDSNNFSTFIHPASRLNSPLLRTSRKHSPTTACNLHLTPYLDYNNPNNDITTFTSPLPILPPLQPSPSHDLTRHNTPIRPTSPSINNTLKQVQTPNRQCILMHQKLNVHRQPALKALSSSCGDVQPPVDGDNNEPTDFLHNISNNNNNPSLLSIHNTSTSSERLRLKNQLIASTILKHRQNGDLPINNLIEGPTDKSNINTHKVNIPDLCTSRNQLEVPFIGCTLPSSALSTFFDELHDNRNELNQNTPKIGEDYSKLVQDPQNYQNTPNISCIRAQSSSISTINPTGELHLPIQQPLADQIQSPSDLEQTFASIYTPLQFDQYMHSLEHDNVNFNNFNDGNSRNWAHRGLSASACSHQSDAHYHNDIDYDSSTATSASFTDSNENNENYENSKNNHVVDNINIISPKSYSIEDNDIHPPSVLQLLHQYIAISPQFLFTTILNQNSSLYTSSDYNDNKQFTMYQNAYKIFHNLEHTYDFATFLQNSCIPSFFLPTTYPAHHYLIISTIHRPRNIFDGNDDEITSKPLHSQQTDLSKNIILNKLYRYLSWIRYSPTLVSYEQHLENVINITQQASKKKYKKQKTSSNSDKNAHFDCETDPNTLEDNKISDYDLQTLSLLFSFFEISHHIAQGTRIIIFDGNETNTTLSGRNFFRDWLTTLGISYTLFWLELLDEEHDDVENDNPQPLTNVTNVENKNDIKCFNSEENNEFPLKINDNKTKIGYENITNNIQCSSPRYETLTHSEIDNELLYQEQLYFTQNHTRSSLNNPIYNNNECYLRLVQFGIHSSTYLISGWLLTKIVYYLMNLQTVNTSLLYFSRHGESNANVFNMVGTDCSLSKNGLVYGQQLSFYMQLVVANTMRSNERLLENSTNSGERTETNKSRDLTTAEDHNHTMKSHHDLTIYCSTLLRAVYTAKFVYDRLVFGQIQVPYPPQFDLNSSIPYPPNYNQLLNPDNSPVCVPKIRVIKWRSLVEIDAGQYDGLTYREIAQLDPIGYKQRNDHKLTYTYPRGESYKNVIDRLERVVFELERIHSSTTILVVAHQAVIRCLLGYFLNLNLNEIPHLDVPLNHVIVVETDVYPATCKYINIPNELQNGFESIYGKR